MKKQMISGVLLTLCSSLAIAHPGHALTSAAAGFMHPLTGWDHLLMLLAVGVWSAKSSAKIRLELPATFILVLAFGVSLGFFGLSFAAIETTVAISLIVMGVLMLLRLPDSSALRMSVVAVFAMIHGLVHGTELSGQYYVEVMAGLLLASLLLGGIGFCIGRFQHKISYWFNSGLALLMLCVGSMQLVS